MNIVLSDILAELGRPDANQVRLRELRAELRLAIEESERKPMQKTVPITLTELLSGVVVILLLAGLVAHLCFALKQSRNNEREMSKRLYQAVKQRSIPQ